VPILRLRIGGRVFAPSWALTALAAALCVLFVHLGRWQWDKGLWRQAEWDAFARGADQPLVLGSRDPAKLPRFQRVAVTGTLDATHQFLLDNRIHAGQAGYEVLTPFVLSDGRMLLVDRGWVPLTGFRDHLPDVHLAAPAPVVLTGRLDGLPVPGLALGRMPPPAGPQWHKVTSFPDMTQLAAVLGHRLGGRIVLLDPTAPFCYVRDWQPPGMSPARHLAYAVQWWGFAVTLVILWGVLSSPKSPNSPPRAAL
jgi:surfeit locus 1 family protein